MAASWYFSDTREQKGPISFDELQRLVRAGRVLPSDLVWQDGMRNWIRADLVDGLFDSVPTLPPPPTWQEPVPRAAPIEEDLEDTTDLNLSRGEPDEEPATGGIRLALIIGSISLGLIVTGLVFVLIFAKPGGSGTNSERYTLNLRPGQQEDRTFRLGQGESVKINVATTPTDKFGMTDVDCDVFDPMNINIASDHLPDKDCFIQFPVHRGGIYRVRVRNLGPGSARCEVVIRR